MLYYTILTNVNDNAKTNNNTVQQFNNSTITIIILILILILILACPWLPLTQLLLPPPSAGEPEWHHIAGTSAARRAPGAEKARFERGHARRRSNPGGRQKAPSYHNTRYKQQHITYYTYVTTLYAYV